MWRRGIQLLKSKTQHFSTLNVEHQQQRYQRSKSFRSTSKKVLKWMTLGGIGVGIGIIIQDKDLKQIASRTGYFWRESLPIWAHYRYIQWKTQDLPDEIQDIELERLHDLYADKVLEVILNLGGVFVKLGQVGSTRGDFVPKPYLERLSTLQDKVPARSGEYARKVIEEAFGKKIEDLFDDFDDKAIAAASIGQVHAAKLKDGTEVVIKIQHPNMEEIFKLDMANSRLFATLAQPENLPLINEFEKQIMTEFNFKREYEMLNRIRENVMPYFGDKILIPRPIPGMVSDKVIVMEKIPGVKLVDGIMNQFKEIAERQGISFEELKQRAKENPPTESQLKMFNWRMKAETTLKNQKIRLYNYTLGHFNGYKDYVKPMTFIDTKKVLQTLLEVHAHQIFIDGVFNGDCHPGNVILMPDGRLGLIDYGQVKELSIQNRIQLSKLVKALAENDSEKIQKVFIEMGFQTQEMNPYVIEKTAQVFFNRCDREMTEGTNLQLFMEHLTKTDKTITFPDAHLFVARTSLLIRGLATILGSEIRTSKYWLPYAEKVLKDNNVQ